VACRDTDIRNVKATILGPPDTPYEFGFFEVCLPGLHVCDSELILALVCPEVWQRLVHLSPGKLANLELTAFPDYPTKAPAVTALTTNSGRCRFNPNIYAAGKVCL
jgi:ubiquitin-conjugating enzyme E2 Z